MPINRLPYLNLPNKLRIILIIAIALTLNSCLLATALIGTAVVAGGAVYYINGNYVIEIPKDIRSVYNSTIKTLQTTSSYSLKDQKYSPKEATIIAMISSEETTITLISSGKLSTEVKIRVGSFGDKKKSENLANLIRKNIT